MSQLYHEFGVTLERRSPDEAWGIRLAGGSDLNSPLIIVRVNILLPPSSSKITSSNRLFCDNKLLIAIITSTDDINKLNPIHDPLCDAILIFIVGHDSRENKISA